MFKNRTTVSLALVCALLGCAESSLGVEQSAADFESMRTLWQAKGVDNYYMELQLGSEWVSAYTLRIEVRNGEATRVRGSWDPSEAGSGPWRSPDAWERTLVMDSLYARLAREIADPEVNVDARFDTKRGLISFASVDRPMYADDAYFHAVMRFVPENRQP